MEWNWNRGKAFEVLKCDNAKPQFLLKKVKNFISSKIGLYSEILINIRIV